MSTLHATPGDLSAVDEPETEAAVLVALSAVAALAVATNLAWILAVVWILIGYGDL